MQVSVTYRGMQSSPTIDAYLQEKIKRLERFLSKERPPVKLEIILEAHPTHAQNAVELRLHASEHHARVLSEGPDLYTHIDLVFDKLMDEIRTQKDKKVSERKHG